MFKLFLDDIRSAPDDSFIVFSSAFEMNEFIRSNFDEIEYISLDHDLGDELKVGNGYDVILEIERIIFEDEKEKCPSINVHSSNISAVLKMKNAVERIYKQVVYNTK